MASLLRPLRAFPDPGSVSADTAATASARGCAKSQGEATTRIGRSSRESSKSNQPARRVLASAVAASRSRSASSPNPSGPRRWRQSRRPATFERVVAAVSVVVLARVRYCLLLDSYTSSRSTSSSDRRGGGVAKTMATWRHCRRRCGDGVVALANSSGGVAPPSRAAAQCAQFMPRKSIDTAHEGARR